MRTTHHTMKHHFDEIICKVARGLIHQTLCVYPLEIILTDYSNGLSILFYSFWERIFLVFFPTLGKFCVIISINYSCLDGLARKIWRFFFAWTNHVCWFFFSLSPFAWYVKYLEKMKIHKINLRQDCQFHLVQVKWLQKNRLLWFIKVCYRKYNLKIWLLWLYRKLLPHFKHSNRSFFRRGNMCTK